jgi:hypothetical protein
MWIESNVPGVTQHLQPPAPQMLSGFSSGRE